MLSLDRLLAFFKARQHYAFTFETPHRRKETKGDEGTETKRDEKRRKGQKLKKKRKGKEKMKNTKTCRLAIGDRVKDYAGRFGTLTERRRGGASFGVRLDANTYTSWYYRDHLTWVDSVPTEPEPYEAWFVA